MDNMRFFINCDEAGKLIYSFDSNHLVVPHLGADVIVNDKIYYVTDVVIAYDGDKQSVDVMVEEVNL